MSMKNPLTPAGIEPATFRFVAQHLNHCATAVPSPSSAVGIQLHVSALYVGHLQVVMLLTEQLYKMCGVFFGDGVGGRERDIVVSIVATMT